MQKIMLHLAVVFAFALAMSAQTDQSAPASPDSKTHGSHQHSGKAKTLTGCLSGPNDEGVYELTSGKHKTEVGGSDDLKAHVGHKVQVTGTWATGAEIGEKQGNEAGEKTEKGEHHLKATSVKMISDTCQPSSASHDKKQKKAKTQTPST
jgi:hypothetical protein